MKIIVSPGWGIGWGTSEGIELALDPNIVKFVEENRNNLEFIVDNLESIIEELYDEWYEKQIEPEKIEQKYFKKLSEKAKKLAKLVNKHRNWYEVNYQGLKQAEIKDIEKGKYFRIIDSDYSGAEYIEYFDEGNWILST